MRPAGAARASKDNSHKNFAAAADFKAGKKLGRPKQRWYEPDESVGVIGHWEKVRAA